MTANKKDIGIEWIGEIPSNWIFCRFKDIVDLYTGNSIKDNEKDKYCDNIDARNYISSKDINTTFNTINYDTGLYIKNDDVTFKIAPKYSILMCIEGGSAGRKKAITMEDVSFVNKLCCFVPKNNDLYYEYLFYFLCSPNYEDYFFSQMTGMIGGVSISKLNDFNILLPPLEDQKKISNFLKKEINDIDNAIMESFNLIEKYNEYKQTLITEVVTTGLNHDVPMKNSGAPWMPLIPAHWHSAKFKFHLQVDENKGFPDLEVLSLYRDYGVIPKESRDDNHNVTSEDTSNYKHVMKGHFVVNKMKAWQGSVAVSEYEGIISPAYYVYKFISNDFNLRYFHYLIRNKSYTPEFRRLSGGIREGQWDLSRYSLENILILIPPIKEQKEIVEFLDIKCNLIDSFIKEKEQLIDKLEEYKRSLIFEYVTGKKEVPK